ncbi:hypothetical protein [Kitasatospora camelliae]|uniref:Uncharacterized protein n=1 Tax=Kitasatospora camelliae TaxID=3156397 RepID=A0AAU8K2G6_9ACTN
MRYRDVPGLSGAANAAIRRAEGARWLPGRLSAAVSVWTAHVHGSRRRRRPWEAEFTCPCCGEGWARDLLAEALHVLPGRAAGELRNLVEELDAVLLRRTHHDPQTPADLPWWYRRC